MHIRKVVTLEELKKENKYDTILPVWVGGWPTHTNPFMELIYTKLYELGFNLRFPDLNEGSFDLIFPDLNENEKIDFDSEYIYSIIDNSVHLAAREPGVLILFIIPRDHTSTYRPKQCFYQEIIVGYLNKTFNTSNSAIYYMDDNCKLDGFYGVDEYGNAPWYVKVDNVISIGKNENTFYDNFRVFRDFLRIKKYVWKNPYEATKYICNMWYNILYSIYNSPLPFEQYNDMIDNLDDLIYRGKKEEISKPVRIEIEKHICNLIQHILKSIGVFLSKDTRECEATYNFYLARGDDLYKTIAKKCINRYIDSNIFKDSGFGVVVNIHEPVVHLQD